MRPSLSASSKRAWNICIRRRERERERESERERERARESESEGERSGLHAGFRKNGKSNKEAESEQLHLVGPSAGDLVFFGPSAVRMFVEQQPCEHLQSADDIFS